jgi:hypothetical protein
MYELLGTFRSLNEIGTLELKENINNKILLLAAEEKEDYQKGIELNNCLSKLPDENTTSKITVQEDDLETLFKKLKIGNKALEEFKKLQFDVTMLKYLNKEDLNEFKFVMDIGERTRLIMHITEKLK